MHHLNQFVLAVLLLLMAACRSAAPVLDATWSSAEPGPVALELIAPGPVTPGPVVVRSSQEVNEDPMTPSAAPTRPNPVAVALPVEHSPNIYRKMGLRFGGVAYANFKTTVQVSGEQGVGAVLDFEDFLGVKASTNVFRLDGFYAFNERHRIDFGYYDISRQGTRTLADPVEVGDVIIPAGDTLTTFGTEIFKLNYRYNFVTDPRTVLAASIGFHTMKINFGVKSEVVSVEETVGATAPLPVIGLHGAYAFSDSWSLFASGEVFQIEIDNFSGTLDDFRLGVNWDIFDHVGLGLELNSFAMSTTVEDGSLESTVEYGYSGLGLYLRGYL